MSITHPRWEEVAALDNTDILERIEVPGGWLYRTTYRHPHGQRQVIAVAMCFVPSLVEAKPAVAQLTSETPVAHLRLSTLAANCLRVAACKTVADVQALGAAGMLSVPNCGKKRVAEIGEAIGGWRQL